MDKYNIPNAKKGQKLPPSLLQNKLNQKDPQQIDVEKKKERVLDDDLTIKNLK